jgi:hypothetical protein
VPAAGGHGQSNGAGRTEFNLGHNPFQRGQRGAYIQNAIGNKKH